MEIAIDAHQPPMLPSLLLLLALQACEAFRAPILQTSRLVSHRRSSSTCMMAGPVPVEDDWTSSASGLQYINLAPGSGDEAKAGDVVKVQYTGWLEESGREFDSSVGRAPIAFNLGQGRVIPGWDEGIAGMRVGGKRRLSIPADLGYGDSGAGDIPGGARLQFECEVRAPPQRSGARRHASLRHAFIVCLDPLTSCGTLPAVLHSSWASRRASTPSSPRSRVGSRTSCWSASSSSAASLTSCPRTYGPMHGNEVDGV